MCEMELCLRLDTTFLKIEFPILNNSSWANLCGCGKNLCASEWLKT